MARPNHFDEGGVVPPPVHAADQPNENEFLLPADVDPLLVALAINEKLRDGKKAPPGIGDDPTTCWRSERVVALWSPVIISFGLATAISRRGSGSCMI